MASKAPYKVRVDKYAVEVYMMTRRYEALNAAQPTITRQPTKEEQEFFMNASAKAAKKSSVKVGGAAHD